ncbi:hypothetical protein JCM10449v2_000368 [Rhodotorula kratochvilovae]
MAAAGLASSYPRTSERTPPSPLASGRRRSGWTSGAPRRCSALVLGQTSWILLLSYLGRRTTPSTLLLFPPAHFLALFVLTRLAVLLAPRLRRQVELTPASWAVGAGWRSAGVAPAAGLLALATGGEAVAVGRLDLGLACTLQALLPALLLLAAPHFDLPAPPAYSPFALAASVAPLLPSVVSISSTATAVPLVCGLMAVAAKAAAWSLLAGTWRTMPGAAMLPFQFLWHAAPIAVALTSLIAFANLALHLPLATSLYPPPSLLLFLVATSILYFITLDFGLAALYDAAGGESGAGLLKLSMGTIPVGVVVVVAAGVAGVVVPSGSTYAAAFTLGTVLLLWAGWTTRPGSSSADDGAEQAWLDSPRLRSCPRGGARTPTSASPPGSPRSPPSRSTSSSSAKRPSFLALLTLLPLLGLLLRTLLGFPAVPTLPLRRLPPYLANRLGLFDRASPPDGSAPFAPPTLDIVFAYFDSPVEDFAAHVEHVRGKGTVRRYNARVSGTYLHHILRRFHPPEVGDTFLPPGRQTSHADMTLFLQHHLAWPHVGDGRFDHLDDRTGYLHLAPWVKSDCGLDLRTEGRFDRMRDLWSMFREDLCPPTLQLSAWAAQFFVSRARIVANPRRKYAHVKELLEAPAEHWTHTEGASFEWGGTMGPSNPFLGHALERSWPAIFNCTDPGIADRCGDEVYDKEACQCFDW